MDEKQEKLKVRSQIALEKSIKMKNIADVLVDLKNNGLLTEEKKTKLLKQL